MTLNLIRELFAKQFNTIHYIFTNILLAIVYSYIPFIELLYFTFTLLYFYFTFTLLSFLPYIPLFFTLHLHCYNKLTQRKMA